MPKLGQKGIAHILFILVAVGLIAFILISSTADFKSKLFGSLFSKQSSFAATNCSTDILNYAGDYWNMDETSGDVVADLKGPHQGNASYISIVPGKIGNARNFSGPYQAIGIGTLDNLYGTASMTFWVKTTQVGKDIFWQAPGIVGHESGDTNDVRWGWIDGGGRIHMDAGNGATAASRSPINDNNWHHIGLTRNSNTGEVKVYVDGILNSTAISETGTKDSAIIEIGRIRAGNVSDGTTGYFQGTLDEMAIWNQRVLTDAEILSIYQSSGGCSASATPTPAPVLTCPSNAVSYWNMNETLGTTLYDSIGTNHGTVFSTTSVTGKMGNARNFDGSTSYISTTQNLNSWLGGTASISFWIKTTQIGNNLFWQAPGITGIDLGDTNDIHWGWLTADGRIAIQAGNGLAAISPFPINNNVWHNVVLTRDASSGQVQVFIDGGLVGSAISETGTKTASFNSIGRLQGGVGSRYFNGSLDDFAIWNKVLTSSEVTNLYNSGNGLYCGGAVPVPQSPTPAPVPVGSGITNPNATLTSSTATFNFTPFRTDGGTVPGPFQVDISPNASSLDVYDSRNYTADVIQFFGTGSSSPIIVSNPQSKWSGYGCGATFYWRVARYQDLGLHSNIVQGTVNCATPTPAPATSKKIFVTSTTFTGNLGGLYGADKYCQSKAKAGGLIGTWKAWLSDGVTSAASRMNKNDGPYKLVNGTTIANSWNDLIDGALANSINITETNSPVSGNTNVWTNTNSLGLINSSIIHCSNWTSSSGGSGGIGLSNIFSANWTSYGTATCDTQARLYCIEQ